jgi:hypothetical protein
VTGLVLVALQQAETSVGPIGQDIINFLASFFLNSFFSSTVLLQAATTLSPENCHLLAHTPTLCLVTISIFESKANIQHMLRSNLLLVCFIDTDKRLILTEIEIFLHDINHRRQNITAPNAMENYEY